MRERTIGTGFILVLHFLLIGILWLWGIRLFKRPTDETTISRRFDAGLGFLLLLLLVKLIIAVKGAAIPIHHSATRPIISFIIIGLFSMGIVRSINPSRIGAITYFKGAGIAMSFVIIILMLGGGLFTLFLPEFKNLAGTSADLLGHLTGPIEKIVVFFFKTVFRPKLGWEMIEAETSLPALPGEGSGGLLEHFFYYFMFGLITAFLLVTVIFILHRLIKWLFFATLQEKENARIWPRLIDHIRFIKRFLWSLFYNLLEIRLFFIFRPCPTEGMNNDQNAHTHQL